MEKRYKTRGELKQEVKELFRGNWGTAIQLSLVPFLIQAAVIAIFIVIIIAVVALMATTGAFEGSSGSGDYSSSAAYSGGPDFVGTPFGGILGIVLSLVVVGISFGFLNWYRTNEKPEKPFSEAFSVFSKKYFLGTVVTMILVIVFTSLWTMLFIIPGIIKRYSYSQAYFIFKDLTDNEDGDHDVKYLDCITQSRRLMDGHKFELFVLDLSFIGWDILGYISFGIGFLWITPYKQATKAAFYQNLVENQ